MLVLILLSNKWQLQTAISIYFFLVSLMKSQGTLVFTLLTQILKLKSRRMNYSTNELLYDILKKIC